MMYCDGHESSKSSVSVISVLTCVVDVAGGQQALFRPLLSRAITVWPAAGSAGMNCTVTGCVAAGNGAAQNAQAMAASPISVLLNWAISITSDSLGSAHTRYRSAAWPPSL